jgi:hypothetical protein
MLKTIMHMLQTTDSVGRRWSTELTRFNIDDSTVYCCIRLLVAQLYEQTNAVS